jgi:hypothetical protein
MGGLREVKNGIDNDRKKFSGILKDLTGTTAKKRELIKFIITKTGKKESTVRTLLSDVKINDEMMDVIEGFFNGGKG